MRAIFLTRTAIRQTRSIVAHNTTLVKNSGAIVVGMLGAAALGFVYWWVAARTCPPETVGRASAYLSLMGLVGLLGEAGLGTLLAGEIKRHPGRERALALAAGCTAIIASGIAGAAALLVSRAASEAFGAVPYRDLTAVIFIVGCCLTGFLNVVDSALLGMLQSVTRMLRVFAFAICKLVLLVAATTRYSNEAAILLSWVAALLISLLAVVLMAWRPGKPMIAEPDFRLLGTLKVKVVDHYLLDATALVPAVILPYVVTVCLSPTSNAAFFVLWMIFGVVAILPASLATVLFPDVRAAPHRYRDKMLLSLRISLAFALAFGLLLLFWSQQILAIFNPSYGQIAGDGLRILGFGLVGAVVKYHIQAGARLTDCMRKAASWFFLGGVLEVTAAVVGCRLGQLQGLTIAWVAAILLEGTVMLLAAARQPQWRLATVPPAALPAGADARIDV